MTIGAIPSTPSYALTDKDRQMIDDLLVNAMVSEDGVANYDELAAALSDSNAIVCETANFDAGKLLNVLA